MYNIAMPYYPHTHTYTYTINNLKKVNHLKKLSLKNSKYENTRRFKFLINDSRGTLYSFRKGIVKYQRSKIQKSYFDHNVIKCLFYLLCVNISFMVHSRPRMLMPF